MKYYNIYIDWMVENCGPGFTAVVTTAILSVTTALLIMWIASFWIEF